MPTWTLARLELFLEKSQLFFEEVVSPGIEMDDLDALCTDHLPAGWRPEIWPVWCPILGRLASALIAEISSKQGASNDTLQAQNLFQ